MPERRTRQSGESLVLRGAGTGSPVAGYSSQSSLKLTNDTRPGGKPCLPDCCGVVCRVGLSLSATAV
jgi:hypothetical protein